MAIMFPKNARLAILESVCQAVKSQFNVRIGTVAITLVVCDVRAFCGMKLLPAYCFM